MSATLTKTRGATCSKCQLRIGISCVCGLKLVKDNPNGQRHHLLPVDRIPKKYQYDPQWGMKFESRSAVRSFARERNARMGPKDLKITLE